MKKNWENPELNNLSVEGTEAVGWGHYYCSQCGQQLTDSEQKIIEEDIKLEETRWKCTNCGSSMYGAPCFDESHVAATPGQS